MTENGHVMRDPVVLQNELDALVVELDDISKQQDKWADEVTKARDAWEVILDGFTELLQIEYDDGQHKGAFPGEARLEGLCRRAKDENRAAWRRLTWAENVLAKKNRRASNVAKEIGGLQSVLKTLGTETSAAGSMR